MNLTLRKDADAIIASSLNAVLPDEADRKRPQQGQVVFTQSVMAAKGDSPVSVGM